MVTTTLGITKQMNDGKEREREGGEGKEERARDYGPFSEQQKNRGQQNGGYNNNNINKLRKQHKNCVGKWNNK